MMSVMIPEPEDLSWIDEMRRDIIRWIWTYPLLVVLVLFLAGCIRTEIVKRKINAGRCTVVAVSGWYGTAENYCAFEPGDSIWVGR